MELSIYTDKYNMYKNQNNVLYSNVMSLPSSIESIDYKYDAKLCVNKQCIMNVVYIVIILALLAVSVYVVYRIVVSRNNMGIENMSNSEETSEMEQDLGLPIATSELITPIAGESIPNNPTPNNPTPTEQTQYVSDPFIEGLVGKRIFIKFNKSIKINKGNKQITRIIPHYVSIIPSNVCKTASPNDSENMNILNISKCGNYMPVIKRNRSRFNKFKLYKGTTGNAYNYNIINEHISNIHTDENVNNVNANDGSQYRLGPIPGSEKLCYDKFNNVEKEYFAFEKVDDKYYIKFQSNTGVSNYVGECPINFGCRVNPNIYSRLCLVGDKNMAIKFEIKHINYNSTEEESKDVIEDFSSTNSTYNNDSLYGYEYDHSNVQYSYVPSISICGNIEKNWKCIGSCDKNSTESNSMSSMKIPTYSMSEKSSMDSESTNFTYNSVLDNMPYDSYYYRIRNNLDKCERMNNEINSKNISSVYGKSDDNSICDGSVDLWN